jgi:hypothetical protein
MKEKKEGNLKKYTLRKIPDEIKAFFKTAETGTIKEFGRKFELLSRSPEIFCELLEGLDWSSDAGTDLLKCSKDKKGGCESTLQRIISGEWRNWDPAKLHRIIKDFFAKCCCEDDILCRFRILVCCLWCFCCCCDCCWPPRIFCYPCRILVFPKDGNADSYVKASRIRFEGANVTQHPDRFYEAVVTITGGGSVTWDTLPGKPSTFTPASHALGSSTYHTGKLVDGQIPDKVVRYSDDSNTKVEGRDLANDGDKLDTIDEDADVNNIPDTNATALTNQGITNLHKHGKQEFQEVHSINGRPAVGADHQTVTVTIPKWADASGNDILAADVKVLASGYSLLAGNIENPLVCICTAVRINDPNYEIDLKIYYNGHVYDSTDSTNWPAQRSMHLELLVVAG